MFCKLPFLIFVFAGLSLPLHAQEKAVPVQIRAVLHDPVNPVAELFYADETGNIVPLNFRAKDLSRPFLSVPVNGSLVLYDKQTVDPENPAESLAASVKLPANLKQGIVVVMPSPDDVEPAYRMLLIDESEKAFPGGESRVVPLIGIKTAIEIGEHKVPVSPGKITRVPPVKKVNEFNMAQTNFYYLSGEKWVAFTERQLQFLNITRRLFIVHATPGAVAPTVTTIVDTKRGVAPR